jgi:hypothetical protein
MGSAGFSKDNPGGAGASAGFASSSTAGFGTSAGFASSSAAVFGASLPLHPIPIEAILIRKTNARKSKIHFFMQQHLLSELFCRPYVFFNYEVHMPFNSGCGFFRIAEWLTKNRKMLTVTVFDTIFLRNVSHLYKAVKSVKRTQMETVFKIGR